MSLHLRTKTQLLAQPNGNAQDDGLAVTTITQHTPEAALLLSLLVVPDLDESTLNKEPFLGWDNPGLAELLTFLIKRHLGVEELRLEHADRVQQIFEGVVNAALAAFNDLRTADLDDTWLCGVSRSLASSPIKSINPLAINPILMTLMESRHQVRVKNGLHSKPITPLGKVVELFRHKMEDLKALQAARQAGVRVLKEHGADEEEQVIDLRPMSDSDVEILQNFMLIPQGSISRSHIFALPPDTKRFLRHTCLTDKIATEDQEHLYRIISAQKFLRGEVDIEVPEGWAVEEWQPWVRVTVALSIGDQVLLTSVLRDEFGDDYLELLEDSSEDEDEDDDLDDVASTIFGPFEDEDEDMDLIDPTEDGDEDDGLDDGSSIIFGPFEDEDEDMELLDTTETGDLVSGHMLSSKHLLIKHAM